MFLSLGISGTRGHFFPVMRRSATSGTSTSSSSYPREALTLGHLLYMAFWLESIASRLFCCFVSFRADLILVCITMRRPHHKRLPFGPGRVDVLVVVGMQSYKFSREVDGGELVIYLKKFVCKSQTKPK